MAQERNSELNKDAQSSPVKLTCLYHDRKWRCKIQFLANQLSGKIIPPKLVNKLNIICTCKADNDEYFKDHIEKQISVLKNFLYDAVSNNPAIWDPDYTGVQRSAESVMRDILKLRNKSMESSKWRLLVVLERCTSKDYSIFAKPRQQNPAKLWKSKYDVEISFDVKFNCRHTSLLFGSGGHHIHKICTDNRCEIQVKDPNKPRVGGRVWLRATLTCMRVEIKAHSYKDLDNAKVELTNRILNVTQKREEHDKNVIKFAEKRRAYLELVRKNKEAKRNYWAQHKPHNKLDVMFKKEMATETFDKRRLFRNNKKSLRMKRIREIQLWGGKPSLVGGHCKHCHMPFTTAEDMFKTKCRRHPAYLVSTPVVKGDFVLKPVENTRDVEACELSDVSPDIDEVPEINVNNKPAASTSKNHRNHHKPFNTKSICKSSTSHHLSQKETVVKEGRTDDKRKTIKASKPQRSDSASTDHSFVTCSDGSSKGSDLSEDSEAQTVIKCTKKMQSLTISGKQMHRYNGNKSMSDNDGSVGDNDGVNIDSVSDNEGSRDRQNMQKWTCCNLVRLQVPNGTKLKRTHYNHSYGGCEYGLHEFVKAKSKREDSLRKDYRKSRSAGRDNIVEYDL